MHIANASEELRQEFNYMNTIHATPKQYGLKVRSHPVMIITSQLKMASGTKMQLSYSSDISETVIFDKAKAVKQKNINAVKGLISNIGLDSFSLIKNNLAWKNVSSQSILDFLAAYHTHEAARRVDTKLLAQYIQKRVSENELTNWTVVIASIGITPENDMSKFFSNLNIGASYRQDIEKANKEKRYTIKRLVDPSHEYLDLDPHEIEKALSLTTQYWEESRRKNKSETPPTNPGGRAIRQCRKATNGLLVIYPLIDDKNVSIRDDSYLPYVGFSISFPKSNSTQDSITYVVTNIFAKYGDLGDY
jgi:hypothetical protein